MRSSSDAAAMTPDAAGAVVAEPQAGRPPAEPGFLMRLHPEAVVEPAEGGGTAVTLRRTRLVFEGKGAAPALERLAGAAVTDKAVRETFCGAAGGDFFGHLAFMHRLGMSGLLDRFVVGGKGEPLARLTWLVGGTLFDARAALGEADWRLSRFAHLKAEDGALALETPLGTAKVVLLDPACAGLFAHLARPATPARLAEATGIAPEVLAGLLTLLANARLVGRADPATGRLAEDADGARGWEFHDLVFHARSRLGRHGYPYGGTFHRKGKDAPPPLMPELADTGAEIALAVPVGATGVRPDEAAGAEEASAEGPAFFSVLERRRSIRDYGEAPLGLAELGAFLWRSARIQQHIRTPEGDMDYSFRPHPGGGAIHELSIYPVVGACTGLARGVYRYDPLAHRLRPMSVAAPDVDQLLEMAWITADRRSRPQVYFAVTAFFERFQWKYQSMAYAAILKNVGALYQTFYLTATAMDLAPCALGGGDSEFFARALQLDPLKEATVGEFVLGSRRPA